MSKSDDEDYNDGRKKALNAPRKYPASGGKDIVSRIVDGTVKGFADYAADPLARTLARTGLTTDKEGKKRGPKYVDGVVSGRRENLGYKKGGSVHRGDGCATKGKTKGKMR